MAEPGLGVEVAEGATRLIVPRAGHTKGPKARAGGPFYNPAMRLSRDLSVAAAAVLGAGRHGWSVLDGLAAVGARGLRMANEVAGCRVVLNDANPAAAAWSRRNVEALGLDKVEVRTGLFDEAALGRFDWVDVDPFGTPAPFIEAGVRAVRHGGVLAVTATDTATLHGVYEAACRRRYDARPLRTEFGNELAVRILAGAVVRAAARHDRAASPLLMHATDHYVRVYVRVEDGAKAADAALDRVGLAWTHGVDHGVGPEAPAGVEWAGPLWIGPLGDSSFIGSMREEAEARDFSRDTVKLLRLLEGEAQGPPLYHSLPALSRRARVSLPPMADVVAALAREGHMATTTHFDPQGVRTDATGTRLAALLAQWPWPKAIQGKVHV